MSTRMEQQENEQGLFITRKFVFFKYAISSIELIMNVTNRTPPGPALNLNREKKMKYVPPKGAPDADLIFGPK